MFTCLLEPCDCFNILATVCDTLAGNLSSRLNSFSTTFECLKVWLKPQKSIVPFIGVSTVRHGHISLILVLLLKDILLSYITTTRILRYISSLTFTVA